MDAALVGYYTAKARALTVYECEEAIKAIKAMSTRTQAQVLLIKPNHYKGDVK